MTPNNLIQDPHFRVVLDHDASSPNPEAAIWRGQHICVAEEFEPDKMVSSPADSVIKYQLAGDRGHYSVLRSAFVSFTCGGYPHCLVAQLTRHQDSAHLVQSNRYTGHRFEKLGNLLDFDKALTEAVFYFMPVGTYKDRQGNKYIYTEIERTEDLRQAWLACKRYAIKVQNGCPYENARSIIPYDFRQNFKISGDLQAVWHWLDQRTKADSQLEIRTLAEMVMQQLDTWSPMLSAWYRQNRYGKARLAP